MASTVARRITAPCLEQGPIAVSARSFVDAAAALGAAPAASTLRAWCVACLFDATERIFESGSEPVKPLNDVLDGLAQTLAGSKSAGLANLGSPADAERPSEGGDSAIRQATGEHYGNLFRAFSSPSYWEEPARLLRDRLERNGIDLKDVEGRAVLDAGCGGGRYTIAWQLLGAGRAVGVDASSTGIADARRRIAEARFEGVEFQEGDVLALPFDEGAFDVVFSNGVLHHTVAWDRGVSEIVRVLRSGGFGWLYLIENPGGLFWDVIEILRAALKDDSPEICREALHALRIPANRIFYMLDHVQVPINVRLTPSEIEGALSRAGATGVKRLTRGCGFDRIEHIARREPFAEVKYGVGENRYVFSKP